MQAESKNKELVRQITQAKNDNNLAKLKEFFAPNFAAHISDWSHPMKLEEYLKGIQLAHTAFKPLVFTIEEIIAEKDKVAARILVTGRNV